MIAYLVAALLPVAYVAGSAFLAASLACLVSRRIRRVCVALTRFAKRHAPRWLAPALIVCALIPGPIDECLVIVAALLPVLRSHRNRVTFARYMHVAWSCGRSRQAGGGRSRSAHARVS